MKETLKEHSCLIVELNENDCGILRTRRTRCACVCVCPCYQLPCFCFNEEQNYKGSQLSPSLHVMCTLFFPTRTVHIRAKMCVTSLCSSESLGFQILFNASEQYRTNKRVANGK